MFFFFFQAEDGIRDAQESRGLGDVYKRQRQGCVFAKQQEQAEKIGSKSRRRAGAMAGAVRGLSLIHI